MSGKVLQSAVAPELLPPEAQPAPPAPPAAPFVPGVPGAQLDPASLQPPQPGVAPGAAVTAPSPNQATLPAQEDPLARAHRLAATDSSQLTQEDYVNLAAEQLQAERMAAAGRGGPTHQVKLGEMQSSTAQRTKVGAEAKAADAAVQKSFAERNAAIDAAAAQQKAEFEARAQLQDKQAAELAQDNARRAEAEVQRQQRMAQLEVEQNKLAQDVAREARSIDPDRWLHQSAGRTIGASLAAALGAYGATLGKTPNYALQIIEGAIERDFQGQKIKLQAKQDQQSMQARVIDRTRALFNDQRAADLSARANLREVYSAQLESLSSRFKGTQVEANAMEAKALNDQAAAKERQQAAHLEDVHVSSTTQATLATVDASGNAVGTGSGKAGVPITAAELNQRAADLKKKNDEAKFTGVPGTPQQHQFDKEAQLRLANFMLFMKKGGEMEQKIRDSAIGGTGIGPFGVDKPLSESVAARDQLYSMMARAHATAMSGKTMTEAEAADYARQLKGEDSSPERRINRLRTFIGTGALNIHAMYAGMSEEGKAAFRKQADAMGPGVMDAILNDRPVNSWVDRAYQAGATSHTGE